MVINSDVNVNILVIYSFAGLQIAPGPLCYNGTSYEIKNSWNYSSFNFQSNTYGKIEGSTYFSYLNMGELFEKDDFSAEDGDIENLLNPLGNWRLPTLDDFHAIFGTTDMGDRLEDSNYFRIDRSGSTVNGVSNVHWIVIRLTEQNIEFLYSPASSYHWGCLVFPDGEVMTGKTLNSFDCDSTGPGIAFTVNELNNYLSQGCVYFPVMGFADSDGFHNWGDATFYMTNSCNCYLDIEEDNIKAPTISGNLGPFIGPVRLVRTIE